MRTIYVKAKNNLIPDYCQITKIIRNDKGEKRVVKEPLSEAGERHIAAMKTASEQLKDVFDSIDICPCIQSENGIEFPFIDGRAYLSEIIAAVKRSAEDYIRVWKLFFELIEPKKRVPFHITPEFECLFGNECDYEGDDAYEKCAIDINPENLLLAKDKKPVLIDYEWWLPVPIPVGLIKYHTVLNIWRSHPETRHDSVTLDELIEECGISREKIPEYEKNIDYFYKHITGKDTNKRTYFDCVESHKKEPQEREKLINELQTRLHAIESETEHIKGELFNEQRKYTDAMKNWYDAAAYAEQLKEQVDKDKALQEELMNNWHAAADYAELLKTQVEKDDAIQKELMENWQSAAAYAGLLKEQVEKDHTIQQELMENWHAAAAYADQLNSMLEEERVNSQAMQNDLQLKISQYEEKMKELEEKQKKQTLEIDELTKKWKETKNRLFDMEESASWKMTKPLRDIGDFLK